MATELSRIDRLPRSYALADFFPGGVPSGITAVSLGLLPPRANPTAATVWTAATYASGSVSVLLAGPDADSTGGLVVPASADLWAKVDASPQVDAVKLERVTVLGGGAPLAAPTGLPVVSVNGKTGAAVVLSAADVGADAAGAAATATTATALDAATATNVTSGASTSTALRAAFGSVVDQAHQPVANKKLVAVKDAHGDIDDLYIADVS